MPLNLNQLSPGGNSVFSTNATSVTVLDVYGLKVHMQVEFSENNAVNQQITISPSWVAGDDLDYGNDNGAGDFQPGNVNKSWLVQTSANDNLSFTVTISGIDDIADEYYKIKVSFITESYNSAVFTPPTNLEISNINNLQLELNNRYVLG